MRRHPLFLGVIESLLSEEIRQPQGDVLATRLEELQSEDENVRRRAGAAAAKAE